MGADPLGDRLRERRRAVRQDHRELLAAEARHRVHRPDALAERDRHVLEDDVAGLVAVRVVDALEVIDVDHQHERRLAGARDAVDLARQRQLEVAPVGQAGERIAARELAQAVDHRLQPGLVAGAAPVRQRVTRLLQQLQRAVEAERGSIAERGVDLGAARGGVEVRGSLAAGSRAEPHAAAARRGRVRRMHAIRRAAQRSRRGSRPQRASGRKSCCRSFRKSKPSGVGRTCCRSRSIRPRRSASASGRSIADSGSPVRSPKRASSKPSLQAQRVEHELERQVGARDLALGRDRRARLGAGHVGGRIAQAHLAHDPVREAELAVRAGADAEVVAELPVVEVVAGSDGRRARTPRPRSARGRRAGRACDDAVEHRRGEVVVGQRAADAWRRTCSARSSGDRARDAAARTPAPRRDRPRTRRASAPAARTSGRG